MKAGEEQKLAILASLSEGGGGGGGGGGGKVVEALGTRLM